MEDSSAAGEHPRAGLGLSFAEDEHGVLLAACKPDPLAEAIDEAWLHARLAEQGYGSLRFQPEAITLLLGCYNAGEAVEALKLGERVDARAEVGISGDGLYATLTIHPPQGGQRLTRSQVLERLTEIGVSEGVLLDAIATAVDAGEAEAAVIARGRAPRHGDDGRLVSALPEVRSRVPRLTESGQVDYRDLGEIQVVHPGQVLMRRLPPTAGENGINVRGQVLPARPGKDVMFAAQLQGAQCQPDAPDVLVATVAGQPVVVKGGVIVEPVFAVAAVNMASGNIRFDGSVKVGGDVAAGMRIEASGDIEIGGTAEPCTLVAGGNIVVKGGVLGGLGRKELADSVIRCAGCFSANYAQQARIEAGDSIFIDDMAMQCELSAGKHIRVGDQRRGHIIGGRALAMLSITGKVLGSPNRIATAFEIGVSPDTNRRIQQLASARDEREQQLLDISRLLVFADRNPTRVDPRMVERACATATRLNDEIKALREEEQQLNALIELSSQARVLAEQRIHEGVSVLYGVQRYRVNGEHGPGVIMPGEGGLVLGDGDSAETTA